MNERERSGPGGIEILTPEGQWAIIIRTSVRGKHLDHQDARADFYRDKRRKFLEHLETIRQVAEAYDHGPLDFYENRRLLWAEWELHSIDGQWITEMIVG